MKTLVKGALLLREDCEQFEAADLVIQEDRITERVAPGGASARDADVIINAQGLAAVPGFINAHGHSYAGLLKGSIDAIPLDIYMLYAIAGGVERSPRAMYVSAAIDAIQMLKRGVTSFVDHFAQRPVQTVEGVEAGLQAYHDTGIRAVVAPMFADKPFAATVPFEPGTGPVVPTGATAQSAEEYLSMMETLIRKWNGSHRRLHVALGTDGPQRCTEQLLRGSAELEARLQPGWQTHILEAKTQAVFSERRFGKPLIQYLAEDLDCINERTSLVHSVWLSDRESDLVAERGAAVVHCLRSNLHLGSGVAPLGEYLRKGIPVALGTDGGNLGSLDMLEIARFTALTHRVYERDYEKWLGAAATLRLLYHGGAQVIDRNPRQGGVGVLKPSAKADIVFLRPDRLYWTPGQSLVRSMLYYGNEQAIHSVMVDGTVVVRDGVVTGVARIDEQALLEEAVDLAREYGLDGSSSAGPSADEIALYRRMYLKTMDEPGLSNRFHG